MIEMFDFLVIATLGYVLFLLVLCLICLPKLRSNLVAYFYRGQREADQYEDMTNDQLNQVKAARTTAEERKETECAICFELMLSKKIVLACSHAYCVVCVINFIRSKNFSNIECPTCRRPVKHLLVMNNGPEGPTIS